MNLNNSNKHEKLSAQTAKGFEAVEKMDGDLGRVAESGIVKRTESVLDSESVDGHVDDSNLRRAFDAGMNADRKMGAIRQERGTEGASDFVVRDAVELGEKAIDLGGPAIGLTIEMMTGFSDNAK